MSARYHVAWIGSRDEAPQALGTATGETVEGQHSRDEACRLARAVRLYYAADWPALYPHPNDVPVVVRSADDQIVDDAKF